MSQIKVNFIIFLCNYVKHTDEQNPQMLIFYAFLTHEIVFPAYNLTSF